MKNLSHPFKPPVLEGEPLFLSHPFKPPGGKI